MTEQPNTPVEPKAEPTAPANPENKDALEHILARKAKQADDYKAKYEEAQKRLEELAKPAEKVETKQDYTSRDEFEAFKMEQRIDKFVEANPEFKEFKDTAKEFARTPQGQGLKTQAMFYAIAGEKLMEIGANKAKQASSNNSTSSSPIAQTAGVDFSKMSDAEFDKMTSKVAAM